MFNVLQAINFFKLLFYSFKLAPNFGTLAQKTPPGVSYHKLNLHSLVKKKFQLNKKCILITSPAGLEETIQLAQAIRLFGQKRFSAEQQGPRSSRPRATFQLLLFVSQTYLPMLASKIPQLQIMFLLSRKILKSSLERSQCASMFDLVPPKDKHVRSRQEKVLLR